jgi:hypothetical protein
VVLSFGRYGLSEVCMQPDTHVRKMRARKRYKRVMKEAFRISGSSLPYTFGGGHNTQIIQAPSSGLDVTTPRHLRRYG